jgi:scyllo-inositol 2-dehydrogenase (NADP+)
VDDYFELILFYPDVKVRLHSSYLVKTPNPRFVLHGTQGSFVKYGLDPQEESLKKGIKPGQTGWGEENESIWGTVEYETGGTQIRKKIKSEKGNYLEYYTGIYQTIREGKPLQVTAGQALKNIHAIELAHQSSRERRALEFRL